MQIQFDAKATDLSEAALVLGMVLPAFVKGCKAQGDTLAEVHAGIAELIDHAWEGIAAAKEGKA